MSDFKSKCSVWFQQWKERRARKKEQRVLHRKPLWQWIVTFLLVVVALVMALDAYSSYPFVYDYLLEINSEVIQMEHNTGISGQFLYAGSVFMFWSLLIVVFWIALHFIRKVKRVFSDMRSFHL